MSLVGGGIRACTTAQYAAGSSRSLARAPLMQVRTATRTSALKKLAARTRQKQAGPRGNNGEDGMMEQKKQQRSGLAFQQMAPNQLKEGIFHTTEKVVLQLPALNPKTLLSRAPGTALEFVKSDTDLIRAYGVPRNLLVDFRILSKPCSVVRDITLRTIETLNTAAQPGSAPLRAVLTGPRGCGKSVLLLQTVEYCAANNNWIVLYIPRAVKLVNSSTRYIYDPRTRTYLQPEFSSEVVSRFAQVNQKALGSLRLTKPFVYDRTVIPAGAPLIQLAELPNKLDAVAAPAVLEALLGELQRQKNYPVLLAVDDVQALYNHTSLYRNPRFEGIKPWHLSLPRLILQYASGQKFFQRGGFLGAVTSSHTTFSVPLELREALGIPHDRPSGPYVKRRPELVNYAKGLQNIPVPAQLQVNEAASIYELWMKDNALSSTPTDETFMTTYAQTGGNAREFVWKGLLGSFTL